MRLEPSGFLFLSYPRQAGIRPIGVPPADTQMDSCLRRSDERGECQPQRSAKGTGTDLMATPALSVIPA